MSDSKRPEPKPGEILPSRKWEPAEVDEMRSFIQDNEPGLWEKLVEIEQTTGDFTDLEIANRARMLIRQKHPDEGRLGQMQMFVALRRLWEVT